MTRTQRFLAFAALFAPSAVFATTPQTFDGLAAMIVQFFSSATIDLIVLAIVIYFWGASKALFEEGEKAHEKLKEHLLWGVIAIFFAVSIWGIVTILQDTVFGGSAAGGGSSGSGSTCTSINCPFGQSE